ALVLKQLVVRTLHVGQAVDVELEHLRRVLGADAVARTQVLVDPDLQRLLAGPGLLLHAHLSCRSLRRTGRESGQLRRVLNTSTLPAPGFQSSSVGIPLA